MLLHRPGNTGSVGRSELAQRVEDFDAGRWSELPSEVRREVVRGGEPQCKGDEIARRGVAEESGKGPNLKSQTGIDWGISGSQE